VDEEERQALVRDGNAKIAKARVLATSSAPYLSYAIYGLIPVGVSGKDAPNGMPVDEYWRIYCNYEFLKDKSVAQVATYLLHGVSHLVRLHSERGKALLQEVNNKELEELWREAACMEINDSLLAPPLVRDREPELVVPADRGFQDGCTAEMYWQLLRYMDEEAKNQQTKQETASGGGQGRETQGQKRTKGQSAAQGQKAQGSEGTQSSKSQLSDGQSSESAPQERGSEPGSNQGMAQRPGTGVESEATHSQSNEHQSKQGRDQTTSKRESSGESQPRPGQETQKPGGGRDGLRGESPVTGDDIGSMNDNDLGTQVNQQGRNSKACCGAVGLSAQAAWELGPSTEIAPRRTEGEQREILERVAKQIIESVKDTSFAIEISSQLREWARGLVAGPQVEWQDILRSAIATSSNEVHGGMESYSYARPARYQDTYDTGGLIFPELMGLEPVIGVILDTSGSIRDEEMDQYLHEIDAILHEGDIEVWVVNCTDKAEESQLLTDVTQWREGRTGGTDLREGFKMLEEMGKNGRGCDIILVFTDGGTLWPANPTRQPCIVLTTSDPGPSWAQTIEVSPIITQQRQAIRGAGMGVRW